MADHRYLPAVVIDNGSGYLKAGFSLESTPRVVFPTLVGHPRMPLVMLSSDSSESYVGYEALLKCGVLSFKHVIERGAVSDWEDMEKIWQHTFSSELKVDPEERPCLMTEAPMNLIGNREKITQIMFETFNVPAFYISLSPSLAIYSAGRSTGLVLDSGHGITSLVPIYEGNPLRYAIQRLNVASIDLTDYLMTILMERGYYFHGTSAREIVNEVKEQLCFVSENYVADIASPDGWGKIEEQYKLPDGNLITLGAERFRCPELLFQPSLLGKELDGIHTLSLCSILKTDSRLHSSLFANIILSGGSTLFPGLQTRLTTELQAKTELEVKVVSLPERKYAAWIGGSVLTALAGFQPMWITRADYEESGPGVVYSKCY